MIIHVTIGGNIVQSQSYFKTINPDELTLSKMNP